MHAAATTTRSPGRAASRRRESRPLANRTSGLLGAWTQPAPGDPSAQRRGTRRRIGKTTTSRTSEHPIGNVGQVIDVGAQEAERTVEYDPYGVVLAASTGGGSFGFSTIYGDGESGQLAYNYRKYQPEVGRWLNRDPIGTQGGLNTTAFLSNGPTNGIDLLGLYQEAGHYYTTLAVALAAGLSQSEALELAYYSQLPDELARYDAIEATAAWADGNMLKPLAWAADKAGFGKHRDKVKKFARGDSGYYVEVNKLLHSLHGGDAAAVRKRRACLVDMLGQVPLRTWEKGFVIHALGDTYSHVVTLTWDMGQTETEHAYQFPVGHAPTTTADLIGQSLGKYDEFTGALYNVLAGPGANPNQIVDLQAIARTLPGNHAGDNKQMGDQVLARAQISPVFRQSDYRPENEESKPNHFTPPTLGQMKTLFSKIKTRCMCETP